MGDFKKRFAKMKYVPKEFYRDCDKSRENYRLHTDQEVILG